VVQSAGLAVLLCLVLVSGSKLLVSQAPWARESEEQAASLAEANSPEVGALFRPLRLQFRKARSEVQDMEATQLLQGCCSCSSHQCFCASSHSRKLACLELSQVEIQFQFLLWLWLPLEQALLWVQLLQRAWVQAKVAAAWAKVEAPPHLQLPWGWVWLRLQAVHAHASAEVLRLQPAEVLRLQGAEFQAVCVHMLRLQAVHVPLLGGLGL